MRKIYKYPVPIEDTVRVDMPLDAKVLCVQMQGEVPCIWVLVDPSDRNVQSKYFIWRGTGHPMPERHGDYVGTVQLMGGSLVFHLFEKN